MFIMKNKKMNVPETARHIYTALNGKRERINYYSVDYTLIKKNILGWCSKLYIITNASYKNYNDIVCYCFTTEDLRNDEFLTAILFGRENDYCGLSLTQTQHDILQGYARHIIAHTTLTDIQTLDENLGKAAEKWLHSIGYKKSSEKQDKNLKIDNIGEYAGTDGKSHKFYIQCKASIATASTKGKGATTNTFITEM